MDYAGRLEISYYNTIANINSAHRIYLVQHRETGKIYIKKILDVYNPHIYEYLKEHHITGTPRLYHVYEENGQLVLIEEYVSGASLQEMIDEGALSIDRIISFMGELCGILEKLHFLKPPIVHRDIKPSNIIITSCGRVVLIDFNAAKYSSDTADHDTVLLGTKGYAAPEQYGFGSSTPQTDIYALGILLKELSRSLPAHTNIFDTIISKCTEMNPSDRMKTVGQLKKELEKLQCSDDENCSTVSGTQKSFAPPGFRTKTPWKMLTAVAGYLFIFWVSLSMEVKDASVSRLWMERIAALLILLSLVFCCFNYRNIQRFMPLCANRYSLIRWLGVFALFMIIAFFVLSVMVLRESFL